MSGYSSFALYYDRLMQELSYPAQAEYYLKLMKRLGHAPGLVLDLACGTGSLTIELARRGLDVYGADASQGMLTQAREKAMDAGFDILFLCQKMEQLDLYGTVDTVLCTMDSINHLPGKEAALAALGKASFFMDPGGWLLFDANTPYKHREVLGNHSFVYDLDEVFCVWQNEFSPEDCRVDISLDFFSRQGKLYRRDRESFSEWAYSRDEMEKMLAASGFDRVEVFHEWSFEPPKDDSQRLIFAARKAAATKEQG